MSNKNVAIQTCLEDAVLRRKVVSSIYRKGRKCYLSGCLNFLGILEGSGYGVLGVRYAPNKSATVYVHRLSWSLDHGRVPPAGLSVLHHCDNRKCFEPVHLFLGTRKDNVLDMMSKKRQSSILSAEEVLEVISLRQNGWMIKHLAEEFGVCGSQISNICLGYTWKHLQEELR